MEQENYEEKIVIPVYDLEMNEGFDIFNESKDYHLKTTDKVFEYKEILAISTKESAINEEYHCSRGGALIFVRDRETPYVTRDDYTVPKIIEELEKNPLACFSGLQQAGSPRIYATLDSKVQGNILVLPNGEELYLTKDAIRKMKFINYIMTKHPKKTCFFETKKRLRKKYAQK